MSERFSASSAARHMACAASANLDLAIPGWVPPVRDPDKGAKGLGTKWHSFFANIVTMPRGDMKKMIQALQYVEEIRDKRLFKMLSEETAEAAWLVTKPNTTADLVLYVQDEMHLIDLKTGKIPVSAVENEQLMFGAVTYGPLAPKAKGVHLHIIQPWAKDGSSYWFADTNRLLKFRDDALATEQKILKGDTTFGPSDHCKFCAAYPHSRGDKGTPLCPATLQLLYPKVVDESAILDL